MENYKQTIHKFKPHRLRQHLTDYRVPYIIGILNLAIIGGVVMNREAIVTHLVIANFPIPDSIATMIVDKEVLQIARDTGSASAAREISESPGTISPESKNGIEISQPEIYAPMHNKDSELKLKDIQSEDTSSYSEEALSDSIVTEHESNTLTDNDDF